MSMFRVAMFSVLFVNLLQFSTPSFAQEDVSSISFESIPGGTSFVVAGEAAISLEANTSVLGDMTATGEMVPGVGIRFPDGTLQTTAGTVGVGITANAGLYSNTIADFTPPLAYTEICIKGGAVTSDIHAVSESTAGGNCLPGDVGWIIERFERDSGALVTWSEARIECLKSGMRLPEPFEWEITCDDSSFAVSNMEDEWEWVSNSVEPVRQDSLSPARAALMALLMGNGSCAHGTHGALARNDGVSSTAEIRCAR